MTVTILQEIFGSNAVQNSTTITVTKSDLAGTGFVPSATNTGDSLVAAILAYAETNIPDSAVATNADQTIGIANEYQNIVTINSNKFLITPKTINFYIPFTQGSLNPNDY